MASIITDGEQTVYDTIFPDLEKVLIDNHADRSRLQLRPATAYSTVYYDTALVFRIYSRGKGEFIEFPVNHIKADRKEDAKEFVRYELFPLPEFNRSVFDLAAKALDSALDSIPSTFDCCSRCEECSNAKKCVNPIPNLGLECSYRKTMKRGKIFYGKNRNI